MHRLVRNVCPLILCSLAAGGCSSPPPAQVQRHLADVNSPIGSDLSAIRDWSPEYTFVDAFKASRMWFTQCDPTYMPRQPDCTWMNQFDTGEESQLHLDASGWVTSLPAPADAPAYWLVGTVLLDGLNGHYPGGQYIVLYDGEGTLGYGQDAVKDAVHSTPGRDVLNVTPTRNGIFMQITATDPNKTGNYLRNIRVIMPGFEDTYATQIFHPDFLAKIQNYRTLRFKGWMETDGSTQGDWSARPLLTDARWNTVRPPAMGKGVPVETMAALSNVTGADPWFNMPHMATDDYVTNFAALALSTLNPSSQVYVEYSNEVWNPTFPYSVAGAWAQQQGAALWSGSPPDAYTKGINYYGLRSAQICDMWKSVWGAQAGRIRCVIAMQAGNAWTGRTALDCPLWTAGAPCSGHGIYALAIAPYFGSYIGTPANQSAVQGWLSDADGGLGKLFTEINGGGLLSGDPPGGALQGGYMTITANYATASARGLPLITYEGGQSLVVSGYTNSAITNLFNNANRDARMQTAYANYLQQWRVLGGQSFVHHNNCSRYDVNGAWGALEYLDQTNTPKYDAIQDFITGNPCWWAGCP